MPLTHVLPSQISSCSCDLESQTLNLLRQTFTILQAVSNYAKGKRFYIPDCIFFRIAVNQNSIKLVDFGNPTTVVFLF